MDRSEDLKGRAPRPVRFARVCAHRECVPLQRRFFFSEVEADGWSCPDHGKAHVEMQVNRPYERPE